MGFLFRKRGLPDLTCIVEREGDGWSATWMSEGRAPRDFDEGSLSSAVERASSEVASLSTGRPEQASAELQLAIYPWQGGASNVMLDITFHSDSIDAGVADSERYLPNPNETMLRWIRPIAEL